MDKIRLLDSDLIINFSRTCCLAQLDCFLEAVDHLDGFRLISTKEVREEVLGKFKDTKSNRLGDLHFIGREKELTSIAKKIFRKIRVEDTKRYDLTKLLQSTSLRNLGERSLIILLFTKYKDFLRKNVRNPISIVSNNSDDIKTLIKNKIIKLESCKKLKFSEERNIQGIYDFYYEIYKHSNLKKEELLYLFFVSNMDARVANQEMLGVFRRILQSR